MWVRSTPGRFSGPCAVTSYLCPVWCTSLYAVIDWKHRYGYPARQYLLFIVLLMPIELVLTVPGVSLVQALPLSTSIVCACCGQ